MATIPLGQFGNVLPQLQQGRILDTGSGNIAQAAATLGEVGQHVANKELKQQQKIQNEKEEYEFNTQAAKYAADYSDIVTETKNKLATNSFDESTAKAFLRQKTDELADSYKQSIPNTKHDKFNYYTEKMYYESEANVKPLAYEAERRKINADFQQVAEATLKIENRQQAQALFMSTLERNPVLTAEQRVTAKNEWDQRRDLTDAKGVLSSLEASSDLDGLQKVYDSVDKVFPYMTVETRDAYKGQVETAITRIKKGQETAQKEFLNQAKQAANDFRTDAYTGYPISAEHYSDILTKVKGTEYEAQIREDFSLNKEAQKFRLLSPLEQERRISDLTTQAEHTPQEDGSLLQKRLSMFQGIATTAKQRAANDPLGQIQSQTGKQFYKPKPEDIGTTNIDFKQAQITTSMLADQKKQNGGVGSLVAWNSTERKAFTDKYFDSSPSQQRMMLTDLTKIAANNKDAMKEYFTLIGGDKNAYDYMGIAHLNKLDVTLHGTSIRAADLALEGKQAINNHQSDIFGKQKDFETIIAPEFGNTSSKGTNEFRSYNNLAYSIYTGLAKRNPERIRTDGEGKPIIDKAMAKQAFDVATGGTFKQSFGKNVNAVFMPYGYSSDSFKDTIENHLDTQFRKETGYIPPSGFLKDYIVRQVTGHQGFYQFLDEQGQPFKNPKTNKPYVMYIPNKAGNN